MRTFGNFKLFNEWLTMAWKACTRICIFLKVALNFGELDFRKCFRGNSPRYEIFNLFFIDEKLYQPIKSVLFFAKPFG